MNWIAASSKSRIGEVDLRIRSRVDSYLNVSDQHGRQDSSVDKFAAYEGVILVGKKGSLIGICVNSWGCDIVVTKLARASAHSLHCNLTEDADCLGQLA